MKRKFHSLWTKEAEQEETSPECKAARNTIEAVRFVQWQLGDQWTSGTGFNVMVDCVEELQDLQKSFEVETKSRFIKSKTSACFGNTDVFKKAHRICWNPSLHEHPYIFLNESSYSCHHGPPKGKRTVPVIKEEQGNDHDYIRDVCLRPTKKLWCPASICAKEVLLFKDFQSHQQKKKWEKEKDSKIIRTNLQIGGGILNIERKICVKLPNASDHKNHTLGIQVIASGTVKSKMVDELHDSASKGELKLVLGLIGSSKRKPLINSQNDHGWTALMFAARNGHTEVASALIENGCDVNLTTKSGQTALDIAKFWNNNSIVELISGTSNSLVQLSSANVNFFGKNPLDRCAALRVKQDWVDEQIRQPTTRFILFHKLNPFVINRDGIYELCSVSYMDISFLFQADPNLVYIFLGLGTLHISEKSGDKIAWFALDVSSLEEETLLTFCNDGQILSFKNRPAILSFDEMQAGVLAQAKSLLTWHYRYKFCPTCSSTMTIAEAGYKRVCSNKDCISLQGIHNTSYPRSDPVVIMLVISPDKQKCLLGRQAKFPPGMFSCLAGYMEPGETIEDAVRREVMEESGIKVGLVKYHSSQPWPMPMQLMIGCIAYATSHQIKVDKDELETARWFTRQQVAEILSGASASGELLSFPPKQAIAHQLIRAWMGMGSHL